jgi:Ran GTPase-activating protein (RanGAP) involved in mRNA processing and transport
LTSLHVGKNNIPKKEAREIMGIAMHMDSMKVLCEVPFKDKTLTELDVSGKNLGTEGALVVAEYLNGNRVLTKFDISSNDLYAGGGRALALGLKDNQVIRELNIADNNLTNGGYDMSGVVALVDAVKDMGVLTSLDVSSNSMANVEAAKALGSLLKGNTVLQKLNISDNTATGCSWQNSIGGGVQLAKVISEGLVGNGAISSINLLKNQIPVEQAQKFVKIMQANENLTTLCGLSREETDLDFSGQKLDAGDAVLIANDISDMGAMLKFTFSGDKGWSKPVTMETTMTEADFSGTFLGVSGGMLVAAFLPKCQ